MIGGDRLIRVQRVTPHVQRVQLDPVAREFAEPLLASRRVAEQRVGIQVWVRSVTTGTDFDRCDLRHLGAEPGQRLVKGMVEEGLEHHRDVTLLHHQLLPIVWFSW